MKRPIQIAKRLGWCIVLSGCASMRLPTEPVRVTGYISMELDDALIELNDAAERVEQLASFDISRYENIENLLAVTGKAKRSLRSKATISAARQCATGKRAAKRIRETAKAYRESLRDVRRGNSHETLPN